MVRTMLPNTAHASLAVLTSLLLAACAGPTQTSSPHPSETTMTACTDAPYVLTQGIGFSTPRLPPPSGAAGTTVSVAPSSIDDDAVPPTVSIIARSKDASSSDSSDLRDLEVGDVATFFGYEIRVTAICPAQAGFELVTAP